MAADLFITVGALVLVVLGLLVLWGVGLMFGYHVLGRSSDYSTDAWSELAEAVFIAFCVIGPVLGTFTFWGAAPTALWVFSSGVYLGIGWAERRFKSTTFTSSMPYASVFVLAFSFGLLMYLWVWGARQSDLMVFGRPFSLVLASTQIWLAVVSALFVSCVEAKARERKGQVL